ncbi:MAG TPA: hypothetical protein V6C52_14625 [Coleofasciculaceae cyanobacterium]|jgi:hypothetical protein
MMNIQFSGYRNKTPQFGAASRPQAVRFGLAESPPVDTLPDPPDENNDKKPSSPEDKKVMQAILFSKMIPLLSCALWLSGPTTGFFLGVPLAYYSGKYGRKIQEGIDPSKLDGAASSINKLSQSLKDPKSLRADTLRGHFNEIISNTADMLKLSQWKGIATFAEPMLEWITKNLNSPFAGKLLQKYVLLRQLDNHALKAGKYAKHFNNFLKGASVNMRVAETNNVFSASMAAVKGLVMFNLGLFGLAIEALWDKVFSGKKEAPQAP